jgi:hypothetical protein
VTDVYVAVMWIVALIVGFFFAVVLLAEGYDSVRDWRRRRRYNRRL